MGFTKTGRCLEKKYLTRLASTRYFLSNVRTSKVICHQFWHSDTLAQQIFNELAPIRSTQNRLELIVGSTAIIKWFHALPR